MTKKDYYMKAATIVIEAQRSGYALAYEHAKAIENAFIKFFSGDEEFDKEGFRDVCHPARKTQRLM